MMRLGGEGEGWIWGDPNEGCGRGLVCDEVGRGGGGGDMGRSKRRVWKRIVGGRWRGVIMICCIGKGVINLIYFTLIFNL